MLRTDAQLRNLPARSTFFIERKVQGSPVTYHYTCSRVACRYEGVLYNKELVNKLSWEDGREFLAELEHQQHDAAHEAHELAALSDEGLL